MDLYDSLNRLTNSQLCRQRAAWELLHPKVTDPTAWATLAMVFYSRGLILNGARCERIEEYYKGKSQNDPTTQNHPAHI